MRPEHITDLRKNAFYEHYQRQNGSGLPVFKGPSILYGSGLPVYVGQNGAGFGDILRGFFRSLIPILAPVALRTAGSFVSKTLKARDEGKSWGEAAKGSIGPSLNTAIETGKEEFMKNRAQSGGRRARRRVYKELKKHHSHKKIFLDRSPNSNF